MIASHLWMGMGGCHGFHPSSILYPICCATAESLLLGCAAALLLAYRGCFICWSALLSRKTKLQHPILRQQPPFHQKRMNFLSLM